MTGEMFHHRGLTNLSPVCGILLYLGTFFQDIFRFSIVEFGKAIGKRIYRYNILPQQLVTTLPTGEVSWLVYIMNAYPSPPLVRRVWLARLAGTTLFLPLRLFLAELRFDQFFPSLPKQVCTATRTLYHRTKLKVFKSFFRLLACMCVSWE